MVVMRWIMKDCFFLSKPDWSERRKEVMHDFSCLWNLLGSFRLFNYSFSAMYTAYFLLQRGTFKMKGMTRRIAAVSVVLITRWKMIVCSFETWLKRTKKRNNAWFFMFVKPSGFTTSLWLLIQCYIYCTFSSAKTNIRDERYGSPNRYCQCGLNYPFR